MPGKPRIKSIKEIRRSKKRKKPKTLRGKAAHGLRLREKVKALFDEARDYAEIIGWDLAKKHIGEKKPFENVDTLLVCFMKYCEWVDNHPWPSSDMRLYKGKAVDVGTGLKQPYLLGDFLRYCGLSGSFWRAWRAQQVEKNSDFLSVIEFVEEAIRNQQIRGAMVGAFREGITSLNLGMKQKVDVTSDDEKIGAVPDMKIYQGNAPQFNDSEAKIIKQLEDGKAKKE